MFSLKKKIVLGLSAVITATFYMQTASAGLVMPWSIFQTGVVYSSIFGPLADLHLINNIFNQRSALALEMAIGGDEFRFNGSYGFALTPNQRLKLTAEYMSQNIKFNFASGTEKERMGQSSIGLGYQYLLPCSVVNNLNFSGYLSSASSEGLDSRDITINGVTHTNLRNIDGAFSRGLTAGVGLTPWKTAQIGLTANYDYVNYEPKHQPANNDNGLGYTIDITQLIGDHFKIDALASQRQPYNQLQADIFWLVPTQPGTLMELGVFASRLTGNLPESGDNRFGLTFSYTWGGDANAPASIYKLANGDASNSLVPWTAQPVIRAPEPFAMMDQKIQ